MPAVRGAAENRNQAEKTRRGKEKNSMKDMELFQTEDESEELSEAQAGAFGPEGPAAPEAGLAPEQEDLSALEAMKALAGEAVSCLRTLMEDDDTSPTVRVKICEMILDRTWGKTSSTVKTASTAQTVQESLAYILSLVEQVKGEGEAAAERNFDEQI